MLSHQKRRLTEGSHIVQHIVQPASISLKFLTNERDNNIFLKFENFQIVSTRHACQQQ